VSLAKKFMGRFMADNAGSISGGDIKITSCSDQIINARFSGGTSLVFHLSGGRIADVSVAGFSIAQAMRSKFTGIIHDHNGDIDALLSYLER